MAIPETVPSSKSQEERILKFCVRRRGENYRHLVLWRSDYCEWDVELGESQFRHLIQEIEKSKETFQMTVDLQESNRTFASAWKCKAAHVFEKSESHENFDWTMIYQSL